MEGLQKSSHPKSKGEWEGMKEEIKGLRCKIDEKTLISTF